MQQQQENALKVEKEQLSKPVEHSTPPRNSSTNNINNLASQENSNIQNNTNTKDLLNKKTKRRTPDSNRKARKSVGPLSTETAEVVNMSGITVGVKLMSDIPDEEIKKYFSKTV